jgi:hypothetical protein
MVADRTAMAAKLFLSSPSASIIISLRRYAAHKSALALEQLV